MYGKLPMNLKVGDVVIESEFLSGNQYIWQILECQIYINKISCKVKLLGRKVKKQQSLLSINIGEIQDYTLLRGNYKILNKDEALVWLI